MGTLFIVSTPIGNLGDITIRAIETLKNTHVILAEDTRTARRLLDHFGIPTEQKEILSFFEGNEEKRIPRVVDLLHQGLNVALITESGTPLISDPGFKLVRKVIELGIKVETIPGSTAVIAALTLSGLPTNAFVFLGFLPKKETKSKKIFENLKKSTLDPIKTVIFYESPYRLLNSLQAIKQVFGNIEVIVARELTKFYQEVRRETVVQSIKHFEENKPRGEFVVLFTVK